MLGFVPQPNLRAVILLPNAKGHWRGGAQRNHVQCSAGLGARFYYAKLPANFECA